MSGETQPLGAAPAPDTLTVEQKTTSEPDDSLLPTSCGQKHIFYYFLGSLVNQIGQACMAVAMPLIMMVITKSPALGTASVTAAAACAAAGQALVTPLLQRIELRRLLLVTLATKALLLLLMSYLYAENPGPWVPMAMLILFCIDSLLRGGIDSLRNVLPMLYLGNNREKLNRFNSLFQVAYQLAVVIGPVFVGLTTQVHPTYACYLVTVVYFLALLSFMMMPMISYENSLAGIEAAAKKKKKKASWSDLLSEFASLKSAFVFVPFLALLTIQGQRLKAVVSTVFCKTLLLEKSGHSAGYIMAGQGAGGVISALLATKFQNSLHPKYWFIFGSFGMAIRTWGWLLSMAILNKDATNPDTAVLPYIFATFIYGYSSNSAAIAMTSLLQARAQSVGVMTLQRFLVRVSGVITKIWVTAIVAAYEYDDTSQNSYMMAFMDISLCLTAIFILPQMFCFLHLHFISGDDEKGQYQAVEMVDVEGGAKEKVGMKMRTSRAVEDDEISDSGMSDSEVSVTPTDPLDRDFGKHYNSIKTDKF